MTLFDGKTTAGWVQRGGKATYTVEDGALVGRTVLGEKNSFLCPPKEYADFVLEFEVWVDPKLNSGVQVRSASSPGYRNGVVHGYQIEIDPSERAVERRHLRRAAAAAGSRARKTTPPPGRRSRSGSGTAIAWRRPGIACGRGSTTCPFPT